MSFKAEVLRVLIASPSDVKEQRDEIEKEIFKWNSLYAEEKNIVLLPGRWENDVVPTYSGTDPQQIINEQLVNKCDILIGVFWTRIGSPTTNFTSGTLEEINIFIEKNKEVMVYFLDKDIPRNFDYTEVSKVDAYKTEYQKKGVYAAYDVNKIKDHLFKKVNAYKNKHGEIIELGHVHNNDISLPKDTKEPIKEKKDNIFIQALNLDWFNRNEFLVLYYILDTGNRNLGFRWMAKDTIEKMKKWENKAFFISDLENFYDEAITNLADRGILEEKEHTDAGNVRLYTMPLNVYDQLRSLPAESINHIIKTIEEAFIIY